MPGGLELDPAILDPGPLAVRGQVHIDSGTNIARVIGLTPGEFADVTGPVFFGLNVAGPAAPFFMNPTQSTAILNLFTSALQGLVPASGGGTVNFLRADGTWAAPGGGGAQGWDDTLAIDVHSGAFSPVIDTLQHLRFGTGAPTQVTGDIRSDGSLFIHPDTGFEVQAHDAIHIHGPDTVLIESTGGSAVRLSTSVTAEVESTGGPVVLDAATFVDITGGYVRFQEQAASTPSMTAGKALLWVRSDTPNVPMFTDDANTDFKLLMDGALVTDLQDIATARILGRVTAATGPVEVLTGTQATTLLDNFTASLKGLVPLSGGGTANFLRADGAWTVPIGAHNIRINGVGSTQRLSLNLLDTTNIIPAATDDAVGNETELRWTFAPVAANTYAANATTGSAAYTPVAVSAESIPARTSGNLSQLTSSVQSILLRAAGSLFFATAAADQTLRRSGSGDLGFGTLVTNNIGDDQVTWNKVQDIATARILGRLTAATGNVEELTGTQATTMLDNFTASLKGLVPLSGGGTTNFLRADGAWAVPPGAIAGHNIRGNGVGVTQRASLNFLSTTSNVATVADDAGGNESEISFQRAAITGAVVAAQNVNATVFGTMGAYLTGSSTASLNWLGFDLDINSSGSLSTGRKGLDFIDGSGYTWALSTPGGSRVGVALTLTPPAATVLTLSGISGNQGTVDISSLSIGGSVFVTGPVADWQIEGFTGNNTQGFWFYLASGNSAFEGTLLNEDTTATGTDRIRCPGFVDHTGQEVQAVVYYTGSRWMCTPGTAAVTPIVGLGKSRTRCEWWEDFEYVDTGSEMNGAPFTLHFGQTHWAGSLNAAGNITLQQLNGEAGHPGIFRMQSGATSGNSASLVRGTLANAAWIRGDEILQFECVARMVSTITSAFFIGFSEDPKSLVITGTGNSNIVGFFFDTAGAFTDTTIHCITREADGTAVNTDTGVVPGGWQVFTISQNTLGTMVFSIDDVVVATHATQVPDTEAMNCGMTVLTRGAVARQLDLDYVSFISQPLDRTV